jgi:hypothetical protein
MVQTEGWRDHALWPLRANTSGQPKTPSEPEKMPALLAESISPGAKWPLREEGGLQRQRRQQVSLWPVCNVVFGRSVV